MATQKKPPLRDAVLPKLPSQATPQLRNHFARLCDLLDGVGRRDVHSQEVYVDETSFRQVLKEFLPHSEQKAIAVLQAIPGHKLLSSASAVPTGTLEAIDWTTLVATVDPQCSPPVSNPALGSSPTVDDIRKAVQRFVPQLPNNAFDNKPLYDLLVKAFGPPNVGAQQEAFQPALYDPWNCMVGHLGFWGAVAAMVFVAICVAIISWIIFEGLPLIWVIVWEGFQMFSLPFGIFFVAMVIVSCLLGFTPP
jgi:hypothetical protein